MAVTTAEIFPGQIITVTCPMGVTRSVTVDKVSPQGLLQVSYALPRGKGRRAWTTDVAWLKTEGEERV